MQPCSKIGKHSMRATTMQDIAERCGVSKVTVSRALRGDLTFVSYETARRIKEVASELGYDPLHNQAARKLALRKAGQDVINSVIALCFPTDLYRYSYFGHIYQGIMDIALERKFSVLYVADLRLQETLVPPVFARGDVDGLLSLMHANDIAVALKNLRADIGFNGHPVVSIMEPLEGCSSVVADEYTGGRSATEHLLDLGHRYIMHFIARNDIEPHLQRLQGIKDAYIQRGLDPEKYLTTVYWYTETQPWPNIPGADEIVLPVLRQHPEITAIFARNDVMAMKIKHSLSRAGIRVPENISLVGFDDSDAIVDDRGDNILTTVRVPLGEIGRRATDLLIRLIMGEESENSNIKLPTELVVRRSTAQAKNIKK